jgi:hypothetical protein
MPYDSESGLYERRSTTVIDASPDGDTVYIAIDAKLDQAADDTVTDLNHHAANGNHYPATSTADDSRFLRQSPSGTVSWANGVVAADAALKDFSNVASGAIAPAKIAQDASNRLFTDTERTKLSGIAASAEVNQNAFSNVAVSGQTTCAADTKTDTLTLVGGTGVTITTNATTDTVTITGADATTSAKGIVELATNAEVQAGTSTSLAVTPAGMKAGQIVLGASATASGKWVEFENIPPWAKRVTVIFSGVSTNGTSVPVARLGDSGGVEATGYSGTAGSHGNSSPAVSLYTTGFAFAGSWGGAITVRGSATLVKVDGDTWAWSAIMGRNDSEGVLYGGGTKTLSGTLDRIRITTVNGTDDFDAGTINISWE